MIRPKKSHRFQMRVPMLEWHRLKALAAERNTTVTAIIFEALGVEPPQRHEQRERAAEERIEGDAAGRHQTASV